MANMQDYKLYDGGNWNGYTSKQHLLNVFGQDDLHMAETVEKLLDFNDGYNLLSRLYSFGVERISASKSEYGWQVMNYSAENYPLIAAYEDRLMTRQINDAATQTPGFRPGANQTSVYFLFEGRPFEITELIGSKRYKRYQFLISDEPVNVGGDKWLYTAQLSGSQSMEDFCPKDEFNPNERWFHIGGAVAEERSERGFGINFRTHGAFKNRLSAFRMEHEIPGNLFRMEVKPVVFKLPNVKGNMWISNVEYEYMRKVRKATAAILMDGKSNVFSDGTIQNVDRNGHAVPRGAGFNDLYSSSNLRFFNSEPDADILMNHILEIVIGKTNQRTADIMMGEWGFKALEQSFVKRYGGSSKFNERPWINDGTGRAFQWSGENGNDVAVKYGQIKKVIEVNGIVLNFVIDPSKDDISRSVQMHPLGGPVSSYEYDIIGLGGKDSKSNLKIVRREGENPFWRTVLGMRGMGMLSENSFNSPGVVSTTTDASNILYFEPGVGAKVIDPTAIVRYYPTQSYVA